MIAPSVLWRTWDSIWLACCRSRRATRRSRRIHVTATDFDIEAFLAEPLTARVATNGPTVRPTWYLWEDSAFWILTGPWAKLSARVQADPTLAITIDVCDVTTGLTKQVIARGPAEVLPFDVPRGKRFLSRYLGSEEQRWDPRFLGYLSNDPAELGTVWVRMTPSFLRAMDVSYQASADGVDI